jgi:HAD superfamily hydrolase (TIGR01484 family)
MPLPRLVAFDLDGTLAASKQPIEPSMAALLARLLAATNVAVTSGGKFEQLRAQVADQLPADANLASLFILPTSGAALFKYQHNAWQKEYEEALTPEETAAITAALEAGARATGVIDFDAPSYGPRIEARGAQVSLSALGQQAPIAEKKAWDPSHEKRRALRAAIAPLLPDYDVKVGGATTIDVTKHGVNKAYGIRQLSERLGIPVAAMLYAGDELSEGGNDEAVKETGIETRAVADPADTEKFIAALIAIAYSSQYLKSDF